MGAVRSPEDLDQADRPSPVPKQLARRRPRPASVDIVTDAMRVDPALRMMIAPDEIDSL